MSKDNEVCVVNKMVVEIKKGADVYADIIITNTDIEWSMWYEGRCIFVDEKADRIGDILEVMEKVKEVVDKKKNKEEVND